MAGGSTKKRVLSLPVTDADSTRVKKVKQVIRKKPTLASKKEVKKVVRKKTSKSKRTSTARTLTKSEVCTTLKRQPLAHLLLEQTLREGGFRGDISTDKRVLDEYSTDESIFSIRPQVVIRPKNQKDVEKAVQILAKETQRFPSLSLTPRAAGTGLSGGSLTDSVVIDVQTYMHGISEVQEKKEVITITCEPGAMWRDIEKKLKKHDAYLPPYPSSKDICSIGGSVGNNAAGPDSLRYGHVAEWVQSLNITLHDGTTYTFSPLTYKELKKLLKQKNAHGVIANEIFNLIGKNEKTIKQAKPKTKKNSAGYALWNVLDVSVAQFRKGHGTFDLTRLISGSQGTIGIITSITMRAKRITHDTTLLAIPIFDLAKAGDIVVKILEYNPINVEIFDGLTFNLALKNPDFFKDRISGMDYYKVLLSMYTTYHVRYGRKAPEFTMLVTLDRNERVEEPKKIIKDLRNIHGQKARVVTNSAEQNMFWQIRRASYSLSKFQDPNKRPAAFLEDMTVPPKNLSRFFKEIKKLLKKYNVTAAVHGHGGNGHFHFYPLLDFTSKATPLMVEKMAEEFFETAVRFDGNICGEHNDGIIRTPHLSKMFTRKTLDLFKQVEHIFDPDDIFNPGKKVNPRFDIKTSLRKTN